MTASTSQPPEPVRSGARHLPALDGLRGSLPPERVGLLDYALWRLAVPNNRFVAPAGVTPTETLARLLPRIRDDAVHAAVAALAASLAI